MDQTHHRCQEDAFSTAMADTFMMPCPEHYWNLHIEMIVAGTCGMAIALHHLVQWQHPKVLASDVDPLCQTAYQVRRSVSIDYSNL